MHLQLFFPPDCFYYTNPTHNYSFPLTSPLPLYCDLWITVITAILYTEAILLPAPKGCNSFSPLSNMTFMYSCMSLRSTWAPNQIEWCWSGWWSAGPSSLCWFDNVTSRLCGYSESNQFSTSWWSLAITPRVHAHKHTHFQSVALSCSQASLKRIRRLCQYEPTDGWEAPHVLLQSHKINISSLLILLSQSVSLYLVLSFYTLLHTACLKTGAILKKKKEQTRHFVQYYSNY